MVHQEAKPSFRYFDRLGETVDGIPAANIFNYDETAMHDNPGRKKVLVRRGTKHPKLVRHASKSMTTVMFCGSASGVLLLPYVIYGSETINSSWIDRGPKGSPCCTDRCCKAGARYSATSSGWIDTSTFENWSETVFFPHARRLNGPKMIIGDNLRSHFSDKVIDICRNNDIRFCSLPPNSTNRTQPLDLAFFGPFKTAWRQVLTDYRDKENRTKPIPKSVFPRLLQKALTAMSEKCSSDLQSGFKDFDSADKMAKLFIGGLSVDTTDESFKQFYSQWGEITDCVVMRDGVTKQSRGFGFITYADPNSVDESMRNRPHVLDGKQVDPKRAMPREMSGSAEANSQVKKLYVAGIQNDHTDESIKEYFSQFGEVLEVNFVTEKDTGKRRGFCFVSFSDFDAVDKCRLMQSHQIDGHRCDVKKAISREEQAKSEQKMRDREARRGRDGGDGGRGGGFRGGGGGRGGGGFRGGRGGGGGGMAQGGGYDGGYGGGGGGGGGGYGGGGAVPAYGAAAGGGYGYQQQAPAAGGGGGGYDWSGYGSGGGQYAAPAAGGQYGGAAGGQYGATAAGGQYGAAAGGGQYAAGGGGQYGGAQAQQGSWNNGSAAQGGYGQQAASGGQYGSAQGQGGYQQRQQGW